MCGIVGCVQLVGGLPPSPSMVEAMRDSMIHRGPDAAGLWIDPSGAAILANRRLAIIEPGVAAAQPMATPDSRYAITFNGEIYNHADIRRELSSIGTSDWRTDHSDTEAILYAFRHWGIECLGRLRGMFAFAIWDSVEKRLWLARDRAGIKPLYWVIRKGRLTFASEIKALLVDPEQPRKLDETSLYHYLSFLSTPAPATLFAGIKKLEAGVYLSVSADGQVVDRRYWDPLGAAGRLNVGRDEAAARVLDAIRDSVSAHSVSDVPVGVFLSGGVDSSTNVALFARSTRETVRTFSIGYAGDNPSSRNELEWAHLAAAAAGAEPHDLLLSAEDLYTFLPLMTRLQDEPIADPVCVPMYFMSKLARDHGIKVCHVGEGSDELFCGYTSWLRYVRLSAIYALPVPRTVKRAGQRLLAGNGRDIEMDSELLDRSRAGQPIFWSGAEAFTDAEKRTLLSSRLRHELAGLTSWNAIGPIWKRFEANAWERTPLAWMSYVDLNLRLPELLLMRVDKMSMGASVEARVPFLDHKLIELALSLPQSVRLQGGLTKPVLKLAVRGLIPDAIIDRPKQGFWVPLQEWLRVGLRERIGQELDAFCGRTDVLDRDAVRLVLDRGHELRSWCLFNLALWHREYIH